MLFALLRSSISGAWNSYAAAYIIHGIRYEMQTQYKLINFLASALEILARQVYFVMLELSVVVISLSVFVFGILPALSLACAMLSRLLLLRLHWQIELSRPDLALCVHSRSRLRDAPFGGMW